MFVLVVGGLMVLELLPRSLKLRLLLPVMPSLWYWVQVETGIPWAQCLSSGDAEDTFLVTSPPFCAVKHEGSPKSKDRMIKNLNREPGSLRTLEIRIITAPQEN